MDVALSKIIKETVDEFIESIDGESNQINTPQFKNWFKQSKVVDANGKPLKMFHGTGSDIAEFKHDRNWFTSDFTEAEKYANDAANYRYSVRGNANIIPVYISIQNPKVFNCQNDVEWHEAMMAWAMGEQDHELKHKGYDGVIFYHKEHTIAYPFEPNQIKSAIGNNGQFSSNPDITKESVEPSNVWDKANDLEMMDVSKYATPELVRAFNKVHAQQRYDGPERMFSSKRNPDVNFGEGYWTHYLEHMGDLVHRLSYTGALNKDFGGGGYEFGRQAAIEKLTAINNRMSSKHYIPLARDIQEQLKSNYEYRKSEGMFNGTEQEYFNKVKAAGERYAQAYEKIQPVTEFQQLGRDIAIDIGRFKIDEAGKKIATLLQKLKSSDWEKQYWTPLRNVKLTSEVVNSKQSQIDTPEFKRWFKQSKIVDSQGNPRIMYHGTNKRFRKFNLKKSVYGIVWLTSDKSGVENNTVGATGHSNIMELYVSMQKPAGWKEYHDKFIVQLKSDGFDGIMLPYNDGTGNFDVVVFDPKQIKSATKNNGQFDSNNADITR